MGLHHLKTVPILFLWLQIFRICVGEVTVQSTTIPGITSTLSSTAPTIIGTDPSVTSVAARTVRENTSTAIEDTSSTQPSSYVRDTSTAVFAEKLITQKPGHFSSSPVETTDEMTVAAEMSIIRNSLPTSLPSTSLPPEIAAVMTNPIGTPGEKLLTSGTTTVTSILPLEATAFASTLVNGALDDTATSVDINSPTTLSLDTQDQTAFKTEHFSTLIHTDTNATTHIGTDGTQSLPLPTISGGETTSAFGTIAEDILTSFHPTVLPFETRVPTHILEDQDPAHTSQEVATSTSGDTDAPFSSFSASSTVEMSSAFTTTMGPISTASLSSTSPLETKATTGILAHWGTTGPSEEVAARTTENMSPGIRSPVTISAVDSPSAFRTMEEVTSTALRSVTSPLETTATTGILGDWDTTSGEAATTEDITTTISSITTSITGEFTSPATTEVISASSPSTGSSPETTAASRLLADQVTTGTSSEVGPSTMGDTTAAISSFNSSSVETLSTFSTTAETTTLPLETTATAGILADEATTGPSKNMTATISFFLTGSTVETQFTSGFSTDATTGLLSMFSPSKTTATTGIITDANTTHASGEATTNTEGDMTASTSTIPAKRSSAALFPPAETTAEVSSPPAGKTIPVTQSSTFVSEASPAFSPTAETIWTTFPPAIALTEMVATTGRASTGTFSTNNVGEVASTPAEMATSSSTAVAENSPAQLFSRTPGKPAVETPPTEQPLATSVALSSFAQVETTGKVAATTGISTAETTPPFVLSPIPGEGTEPLITSAEHNLSISLPETTASTDIFAAGTTKDGATSAVVEETPSAVWSSPAQTERFSISAVTEETAPVSLLYTSPTETSSTLGATSEVTLSVFPPTASPVETTTKASIATDIGTDHTITTKGKTSTELPSANTRMSGRTVTAKLPTPSDPITSLPSSKPAAAHDLGRIRFILSMSLTTSLNITDPAVRDAVAKKFHQDLHARFPDAGFSVTWIGQQQES